MRYVVRKLHWTKIEIVYESHKDINFCGMARVACYLLIARKLYQVDATFIFRDSKFQCILCVQCFEHDSNSLLQSVGLQN